jgi:hypothetical protein
VLVDYWGIMRSGRPAFYDTGSLEGACTPVDQRAADYCAKARRTPGGGGGRGGSGRGEEDERKGWVG